MTLLLGVALADALGMGLFDCPRGSLEEVNHNGVWCEASVCTSDADCGGTVCSEEAISLCVETSTMPCGGLGGLLEDECTETRNTVIHRCGPGGECVSGACQTARRCVYTRAAPETHTGSKSGCQTSGLGGLLLLLAGLFGRARPVDSVRS